jgi:IclR family transcriptional regulator, mhp operon transcriptional activator
MARDTDGDVLHGLSKGLRVLATLNQRYDISVLELSRATGIPRPTVHRILNTLMSEGFVNLSQQRGRYRVAIGAKTLSQGYQDAAWITDIAGPVLSGLRRKITWPSDVATYAGGAMIIRRTTNHLSPLNLVEMHVGSRIPVLQTALGCAYFAFCTPETREAILLALDEPGNPDRNLARDRKQVARLVESVRETGYAVRDGGVSSRTFALALPVHAEGRVIAALNIILAKTPEAKARVLEDCLPFVRAAVADLERKLKTDDIELSEV